MTTEWRLIGFVGLATLALHALPAAAQTERGTHEIQIRAGELFGDDVVDASTSGTTPELDDDVAFGVRYGYNFTNSWGIEVSLGYSPTSVTDLAGADVDIDLATFDVDAVRHFGSLDRWAPYVIAGVGYAWADLETPLTGTVGGQTLVVDDDNGYTLNAGVGAKYFATKRVLIQVEARYRYVDALLDPVDHSLDTFETSVGVGWRF